MSRPCSAIASLSVAPDAARGASELNQTSSFSPVNASCTDGAVTDTRGAAIASSWGTAFDPAYTLVCRLAKRYLTGR